MKFFLCILVMACLFSSCSQKEKKEAGILPEKKMVAIAWDMVRADQFVTDYIIRDSGTNKKNERLKLYEEIFRIHKITREQFKKSLDYYSSNPGLFQPILDSLVAKQKTIPPNHPVQPTQPFKRDSILNHIPARKPVKQ